MVDGAPQVILARRADTGPKAVLVQVRCGIEFELNGPPTVCSASAAAAA